MLNLVVFETEEELCELTGLTEEELWQKGFNLDDWEIGFQSEVKLHKTPTKKDIENGYRKNELIALFDSSTNVPANHNRQSIHLPHNHPEYHQPSEASFQVVSPMCSLLLSARQ